MIGNFLINKLISQLINRVEFKLLA